MNLAKLRGLVALVSVSIAGSCLAQNKMHEAITEKCKAAKNERFVDCFTREMDRLPKTADPSAQGPAGAPGDALIQKFVAQRLPQVSIRGGSAGMSVCKTFEPRSVRVSQVAVAQRGAFKGYWPVRAKVTGECIFLDEFAPLRRPSYVAPFQPRAQSFLVQVTAHFNKNDFDEWTGDVIDVSEPVLGAVRNCSGPC